MVIGGLLAATPLAGAPLAAPAKQSVLRLRRGSVKVWAAARKRPPRRGLIGGRNAVFPLLGKLKAPGCRRTWYRIGPEAFVCSRRLRPGRGIPKAARHPRLRKGRLMPNRYFVTRGLTVVRAKPSPSAARVRTLRDRSGFVVRGKVRNAHGVWRRTRRGYLPVGSTRYVRPSKLVGVKLGGKERLPISWISGATAWVTSRPTRSRRARVSGLKAYNRVTVLARQGKGKRAFVRIGKKRWVPADRVRTAKLRKVPKGVGASDKWIHVSKRDWTLVAYVGKRPVYAALISRGYNTPTGRYRVTRKLASGTLRFHTRKGEYEAEAVPWIVYFKPRFAFHSAYWHDGFGAHGSHGCINLSPTDAKWLFEWTAPTLPPGWYQIHQTPKHPGTFVLIE